MKTHQIVPPAGLGARTGVEALRAGERKAKRHCGGALISQAHDESAA